MYSQKCIHKNLSSWLVFFGPHSNNGYYTMPWPKGRAVTNFKAGLNSNRISRLPKCTVHVLNLQFFHIIGFFFQKKDVGFYLVFYCSLLLLYNIKTSKSTVQTVNISEKRTLNLLSINRKSFFLSILGFAKPKVKTN